MAIAWPAIRARVKDNGTVIGPVATVAGTPARIGLTPPGSLLTARKDDLD